MSSPTIHFENTGRNFRGKWALRGMNATISPGTICGVLGANGAGKSTLLRLLAGWLPVSEGRILVDESPMRPTAIHLRRQAMLLDDATGPTKRENGASVQDLCDTIDNYQADRPGIENEVADWFEKLDVISVYKSRPGEMSKGQAYKIAMIGLFVTAPHVWLLDEPFSAGLDASGLRILEEQMAQHAAAGGIVLFSSQWPEHARRLADWALVLHEGSLEWSATPETLPTAKETPPSLQAVLQGLGPQ
ncbi:hypothetical protein C5Y96_00620 [Blastopirellula marina]|uniref:ABC transporter domain-containing protein n=1 Tax=Blastopirellula marina TaxID=124 RepID=A0A2S8GAE5_9BACT|nr:MULTISPECIES: ATP-binding cassette domain-containing protein [Pirellulaceae]PQO41251.1 hypothetical protein C5Y96_00620 [Blastopirellula marina]RCS56275.1 ATP-binding cassette domain-containing protein [Bremerella cremea]